VTEPAAALSAAAGLVHGQIADMIPFPQLKRLLAVTAVLLLVVNAAAAAPAAARVPTPPRSFTPASTCTINIVGKGADAEREVESASISCKGSSFSMAVSPTSLGKFKKQFKGVTWNPDNCWEMDCLVTICGDSSVTIVDSSISNFIATESQGTLCIANSSQVLISDSSFSDNTAENGTIHVRDEATVTLRNSAVSGATGIRGGAAQISDDAVFTTINSIWTGNYASYGASMNVRNAATVWIVGGNVFDSNTVEDLEYNYGPAGAVVYCRAEGKVYLQNKNILINNMALGYDSAGAAIFLQDDCVLDIRDGNVFINNTSNGDNAVGGAISATGAALVSITDTTFYNNSAQGENPGGGALLLRDESVTRIVGNVNFTHNMVLGDVSQGGAIYVSNDATLLVEDNIIFINNSADGVNCQGGAINTRQNAVTTIRKGITFKDNSASYGGGVAAIGNMPLNLSDAVFTGHHVLGHGGALYLEGSFTANIANTTVTDNRWVLCNMMIFQLCLSCFS
jgi:predicted outer membrane repeat protein